MDDLTRVCCLNEAGPDFGVRGAANRAVHGRDGAAKPSRLLRCRTGRTRFSERKGTALDRSHLLEETVVSLSATWSTCRCGSGRT